MTSLQATKPNAVLALAQYTYTRTEPLFAQAKKIEPSIEFSIDMSFADESSVHLHESSIFVKAWWKRDSMFQQSSPLRSTDDVDQFAAKLAADVAALAPLDVAA
jgi:hypothetical protein